MFKNLPSPCPQSFNTKTRLNNLKTHLILAGILLHVYKLIPLHTPTLETWLTYTNLVWNVLKPSNTKTKTKLILKNLIPDQL